jgi:hypothetical protein
MVNEPKQDDAPWYKDAIIYQVHVRAFADSDADGIGDFEGITSKLDYVHELGATAIWLLPFYPSPLRDATPSPTTQTSTLPTAICARSAGSCARRIAAASASSPSS